MLFLLTNRTRPNLSAAQYGELAAAAFAVIRASSERYSGSASSARASSSIGAIAGVIRAIGPVRS